MIKLPIKLLTISFLTIFTNLASADDSEIFFSKDLSATKPNIIFLLDTSGSMNGNMQFGPTRTRLDVLKGSLEQILTDPEVKNLRIGMMTFDYVTAMIQQVIDIDEIDLSKDIPKAASSNTGYTILSQSILTPTEDGYQAGTNVRPILTTISYNISSTNYAAYRFNNILVKNLQGTGITANDAITKAELVIYTNTTPATTINIYIDPADNAPYLNDFTDSLRARASTSGTPVTCTSPNNSNYFICDVTQLIKDKIAGTEWQDGNAIAFYANVPSVTSANVYFSETYNTNEKPKLNIEVKNELVTDNKMTYRDLLIVKALTIPSRPYITEITTGMFDVARYVSNIAPKSNPGPYHDNRWGTSPLLEGCQLTHMVVMTDGSATNSNNAQHTVAPYIGQTANACKIFTDSEDATINDTANSNELCGRALVSWMARKNQSNLPGGNYIRTQSIGFAVSNGSTAQKFIDDIATYGMGKSYNASNAAELTKAFSDIVTGALVVDSPSTSGQVTMSPQSKYKQRNEVYYALYKSENYDFWPGNMKGFQIKHIETTLTGGAKGERAVLYDKNGVSALGADGAIKNTASSFWSTNDGGKVEQGGVVDQLKTPDSRNVFTIDGSNNIQLKSSAGLTNTDLALTGDNQDNVRKGLLDFIRGYKYIAGGSTEEAAKKMGDSAKSGVTIATYGCASDKDILQCGFDDLRQVAMLASNDGFIRGFNVKTGQAIYEYMPKQMLPIIKHLQTRKTLSINEVRNYGLDGDIVLYHDDKDDDGYIDAGEDAYAYVASGRGGPYLYAVNIADMNSPKLVWIIDNNTSGFEKLGEAWSTPVVGKIDIAGTVTPVLIFGGGYDIKQDTDPARSSDNVGNALYIVNAKTGAIIWSKTTGMDYSIPSSVAVVTNSLANSLGGDPANPNNDLITDIFVGDTGGQLWRFQVNNGSTSSLLIESGGGDNGIIAKFADNAVQNSRKFYYPPVITEFRSKDYEDILSVSIGSGYRGHPLSTDIEDRIYSLRVPKMAAVSDHKVITENDLAITSLDGQTLGDPTNLENGFVIRLGAYGSNSAGEKVVSRAYADFDRIVFNTYVPTKTITTNCVPGSGTQRTYNFDIVTGESMLTTAFTETSVSTLPPDVNAYCNGKFCTIVPSLSFLSENNTLPDGKGKKDPWVQSVGNGLWSKLSYTDFFDPTPI